MRYFKINLEPALSSFETEINANSDVETANSDKISQKVKPEFVLNSDKEINLRLTAGQFGRFMLPATFHREKLDVSYTTIDLGQAAKFLTIVEKDNSKIILKAETNSTTNADVGTYNLVLQLTDSAG